MMSEARRAAVWWLVLAAVIVAGDHLLALALDQILIRSQFRYSRLYRGGNDADIVIIGDSRGVNSFYAPALEQMTGLRALNLSYNSLSPHVAEAVLLDYLERNRTPRMVVIEATSAITSGAVASQLRTYAGLSPRMAALYARDHPFEARAARLFWLFPLNSEFFLEALHYMRRSDQDWIMRDVIPDALRRGNHFAPIQPLPDEIDALARLVRELQQRGIEVRIVIAPYAPVRQPTNTPQFIALIEGRTGVRVWNYVGAVKELDSFADTVHLNERGSRELLAMMVRDGAFGMAQRAARF
jgi:hypothetical protein